jgi:hypothetical protein
MEPTEPGTSPAVETLKHYARILQQRVQRGESEAIRCVRVIHELAGKDPAQLAEAVQRKHCLTASALQLGFRSWMHAVEALEGRSDDFGTLLYPSTCYGHYNIWSAHYAEAREIRAQHGGYLLAYKRQFLIVECNYIESLGLEPEDPDLEAIGRDWVKPADYAARARLYEKLVHNALVRNAMAQS